jgi:uncharacterized membrane protein YvlD (DUF360 family)
MNGKLKKELKAVFEAPSPIGKERFLKQLRYPKITYQEFLFNQLHYIRKRVWLASALIVLLGLLTAFHLPIFDWTKNGIKIWSISSVLPFLALITITEVYRSSAYNMSELEGSCRFSVPQIVMARMSILGTVNSVVLVLLLILINRVSAYSLPQTILYVTVPYLVVCAACLWLLNRMHGSDGIYACAVAACLVSLSSILCEISTGIFYSATYINGWLTLYVVCFVLIGFQMHKLVKQLEEKQWNLSLTE